MISGIASARSRDARRRCPCCAMLEEQGAHEIASTAINSDAEAMQRAGERHMSLPSSSSSSSSSDARNVPFAAPSDYAPDAQMTPAEARALMDATQRNGVNYFKRGLDRTLGFI